MYETLVWSKFLQSIIFCFEWNNGFKNGVANLTHCMGTQGPKTIVLISMRAGVSVLLLAVVQPVFCPGGMKEQGASR